MNNFTVIIPSHRPELAKMAAFAMAPIVPMIHANKGYPSFSKLINDSIMMCPTETVIICNDKARPTADQEAKTVELLGQGFGFVGLHNFRHFGFTKDLIRRVGFFDERYEGGEYEDFDFLRRIQEKNIAVYMSKEVKCVEMGCSWNSQKAYEFNHKKWKEHGTHTVRVMPDEIPRCTLPSRTEDHGTYTLNPEYMWKPWKESVWLQDNVPKEFK